MVHQASCPVKPILARGFMITENGELIGRTRPVSVKFPTKEPLTQIASRGYEILAITETGKAHRAGLLVSVYPLTDITEPVLEIATGYNACYCRTATDLWSWGECGTYCEHGLPPPLHVFVPFKVKQLDKYHVKRVWAGMYNCVVLVVDKSI